MDRKVVVYIAISADGYIATPGGGLEWLDTVQRPGEDYGYSAFIDTVDTVIMGRKTYDKVLGFGGTFPHTGRKCYVASGSLRGSDDHATFFSGNLKDLVAEIRTTKGKDIFVDGGADVINQMMTERLIDRYILSLIPVFLGSGVSLFKSGRPLQNLKLTRSLSFPSGLVQNWYDVAEQGI